VCIQKAKYFEQKDNRSAAEPDEGIAAMKGARFVCVDEFKGQGHFNAILVKNWCDVDGTPLPFERKFGARDEIKPSWLMAWFTNKLPCFNEADEAFTRRPSIMPMYISFKAEEDRDKNNATEMVADNTFKDKVHEMVPEFIFWLRCLVPSLYCRSDTTVLRPRPAVVEEATRDEVKVVRKVDNDEMVAKTKQIITDKLIACTKKEVPPKTEIVNKALADHHSIDQKECKQLLLSAGLKTQTVTRQKQDVWAYFQDKAPMRFQ